MTRDLRDALAFRIGASALGMFAGTALGLVLGCFGTSLPAFVFGGAASGVVTGLLFPEVAMRLAEGTLHFFIGLFGTAGGVAIDTVEDVSVRPASRDSWLSACFAFGVAYALILWAVL